MPTPGRETPGGLRVGPAEGGVWRRERPHQGTMPYSAFSKPAVFSPG